MTTLESNRAVIYLFCERLSRRDTLGMAELASLDANWWVIGRTDYAPYGGRDRVKDILQTIKKFFGPLRSLHLRWMTRPQMETASRLKRIQREGTAPRITQMSIRCGTSCAMEKSIQSGILRRLRNYGLLKQLGGNNGDAFDHLTKDGQEMTSVGAFCEIYELAITFFGALSTIAAIDRGATDLMSKPGSRRIPPSITISVPVTKRAADERKVERRYAISRGRPASYLSPIQRA